MTATTELEKAQELEIQRIKALFLRARGWISKPYYGWSSPRAPLSWKTLEMAYEEECGLVRHWTSFKTRRSKRAALKRSKA